MAVLWKYRSRQYIERWPFVRITRLEYGSPNHLWFQCFEEGFNHGIILAIAFARDNEHDIIFLRLCLIIKRTILVPVIGMMDQAFWRSQHCYSFLERLKRQLTESKITDDPADETMRVQVNNYRKIQPCFACPYIYIYVSPYFRLGSVAAKSCTIRLGAVGKLWWLSSWNNVLGVRAFCSHASGGQTGEGRQSPLIL